MRQLRTFEEQMKLELQIHELAPQAGVAFRATTCQSGETYFRHWMFEHPQPKARPKRLVNYYPGSGRYKVPSQQCEGLLDPLLVVDLARRVKTGENVRPGSLF